MKRIVIYLALALALAPWATVGGQDSGPDQGNRKTKVHADTTGRILSVRRPVEAVTRPQPPENQGNPAPSTPLSDWTGSRSVHIDLSRPAAHGNNNNPPFQIRRPSQEFFQPFQGQSAPAPNTGTQYQSVQPGGAAVNSNPAAQGNVAHHHHAYTPGYVRKKLEKIGVTSIPYPIADRAHLLDTDKAHSILQNPPTQGPAGKPLSAALVSARRFNDPVVRTQMTAVNNPGVRAQVIGLARTETRANHYYWHKEAGTSYCHYIDNWGYQWYGWYVGDRCFWTRYYSDRWWWYDTDYGRWCFWNDGWWWWQDPYHVGDLYLYDGDQYVPCNSANDRVVVTTVEPANPVLYRSQDGTRVVKVMGQDQDAFLYDTSIPPSFNPVYLASQVKDVKYSNTENGGALQVMLTLSDGSVNLFDDQGNPLNFSEGEPETDPGTGAPAGSNPPPADDTQAN